MPQQPSSGIDAQYLETMHAFAALCELPVGIYVLRMLVRLCGQNRPIMSLEEAARRDVWLSIQRFIPVEKLSEIEHFELRQQQEQVRQLMEQQMEFENFLEENS